MELVIAEGTVCNRRDKSAWIDIAKDVYIIHIKIDKERNTETIAASCLPG